MSEKRIAELESQAQVLSEQLSAVSKEIRKLKEAASAIQIGDIVQRNGKEYRIVAHDDPEWGWFFGVQRLKNGSWGEQRRRLYGSLTLLSKQQNLEI